MRGLWLQPPPVIISAVILDPPDNALTGAQVLKLGSKSPNSREPGGDIPTSERLG